eukprot:GILK01005005.1.p1 GENE.GILK01005005.1~~GILK01005005.1.p1  ORF type:complete len:523 (+),score=54.50 GILK01005005.1:68-1570(+)
MDATHGHVVCPSADHHLGNHKPEDTQPHLERKATFIFLWGLGVGAVVSGNFFGWNMGLDHGGFGGLLLATGIVAVMYICLVLSIAEMSCALPFAGGFYTFAREALGPWGGFLVGVTNSMEYIVTPAVIVVGIGNYLSLLIPVLPNWLFWILCYVLFVGVNIWGVELTLKFNLVITSISLFVLAFFYFSVVCSGSFDASLLTNLPPQGQHSALFPNGASGVFSALPFAMWFFLAIEELPLASEECTDVVRDMPRALQWGIGTLIVLAALTITLNTGIGTGVLGMSTSLSPLIDGFEAVYGKEAETVLILLALVGMVTSFHSIVYGYGRVLFALARAGYFPKWLASMSRRNTPYASLIVGGGIGLLLAVVLNFVGEGSSVGAGLLNMAVFGAGCCYIAVMISFVLLRVQQPMMPRPYKSPLGVPGAIVAAILAAISLAACFSIESYRPGMYGMALFLVCAVVYFAIARKHLRLEQRPVHSDAEEKHPLTDGRTVKLTADELF